MIYLDWNATTPPHPIVLGVMLRAAERGWANPSSVHAAGRAARDLVEKTREQLAALLEFSPRDVVLTGSGSEANHLALSAAEHIVTSRIEHPSIVAEAERLAARGVRVDFIGVDADGRVRAGELARALAGDAPLRPFGGAPPKEPSPAPGGGIHAHTVVAVAAANHETGVIQPLREVSRLVREAGASLHVDAVQLLGRAPLEVLRVADTVSVAAHKIRGPKGIGALLTRPGARLLALHRGGAQERGLRPGTQDAVGLAGFGAALGRVEESRAAYEHLRPLRDALEAELRERYGERIVVYGAGAPRLGHVSNFALAGVLGDELVAALDLEGVCVSAGSACSAGTQEPSAVIQAMLGRDAARGAVRVSLGEDTTRVDIDGLLAALDRITKRLG